MRRMALAFALFAACHSAPRTSTPASQPGSRPGAPVVAGGGTVVAVKVEVEPAPATGTAQVGDRRRGAPHFAQISGLVVDRAGTRVLSKDFLGAVRIWPTLDGAVEPQAVPVKSPDAMAIEARGDG